MRNSMMAAVAAAGLAAVGYGAPVWHHRQHAPPPRDPRLDEERKRQADLKRARKAARQARGMK